MKGRSSTGTNYYWHIQKLSHEDEASSGLHIGKDSCGWVFHFQAQPSYALGTVAEWKNFTKTGYIYDEYGRLFSHREFWGIVKDTKLPLEDGREPWHFNNAPDLETVHIADDYMNKGYMFTVTEFC